MLGARIRLGLDYFKWSSNTEVEGQISLGVIGECELAGDRWCLLGRDSPLLDLDLLPAIEAVRLVDAELWRDRIGVELECDCAEAAFLGQVVRVVSDFNLLLGELG